MYGKMFHIKLFPFLLWFLGV